MIALRSRLEALRAMPWPMEPTALAALLAAEPRAEPPEAGPRMASKVRGNVAVIGLEGTMFPEVTDAFAGLVRAAAADRSIGAIVLAVDSPGGVITGVPEAADAVFAVRGQKPIVAVATGMMASAAYWAASGADVVVASPSAYTGSIGVWTMHADLSKMLEQAGVAVTLISAGKYKVEGNWLAPLGDEAKAAIQADVNDAYDQFVGAVARNRGATAAAVKAGYGEGRVLNARRAKDAGLVDRIGTLDEIVGRLAGSASPPGRTVAALRRRLDLDESA